MNTITPAQTEQRKAFVEATEMLMAKLNISREEAGDKVLNILSGILNS